MQTFKFPDEVDNKGKPQEEELDIQIEEDEPVEVKIVDDAPPEDQHIEPLPEKIKEELEQADEAEDYSQNVKQKFKQYKKAWHDERRAKEAAYREQQEALTMAQKMLEENKRLKNVLQEGEKELISTYKTSAESEVDLAKRNYKEAYDSGDSDKVLEAQQELIRAQLKLDKAKNFKPTVQTEGNSVQTSYVPPVAQQQMDPKVASWVSRNPWFTDPKKKSMSSYARGVHEELAEKYGGAYIGTDEYFTSIDKEVRRRFPEEFGLNVQIEEESKPTRTKSSPVVASAKRTTAPKQVTLSKSAQAIAKKLGLTNEQYAREQIKLG